MRTNAPTLARRRTTNAHARTHAHQRTHTCYWIKHLRNRLRRRQRRLHTAQSGARRHHRRRAVGPQEGRCCCTKHARVARGPCGLRSSRYNGREGARDVAGGRGGSVPVLLPRERDATRSFASSAAHASIAEASPELARMHSAQAVFSIAATRAWLSASSCALWNGKTSSMPQHAQPARASICMPPQALMYCRHIQQPGSVRVVCSPLACAHAPCELSTASIELASRCAFLCARARCWCVRTCEFACGWVGGWVIRAAVAPKLPTRRSARELTGKLDVCEATMVLAARAVRNKCA
jgi:hypothetical protein